MKISKHDQKLILVLLGLAIFLAAYFGICRSFNNKKSDIESQITELQAQVDTLNGYLANQTTYQSEIDRISSEISAEFAKYPDDVRSEDLIMYATELEEKIGLNISSISISSPEVVSTFSVPEQSGDSYEVVPIAVVKEGMTVQCTLSYEQLKKLIDYIYANSEKSDIANLSMSYDAENADLFGTITIDKYFIVSADYTYTQTDIPSVDTGTDNPFGTFSIVTTSATPSAG